MTSTTNAHARPPFWRDERVLKVVGQIVFVILVFLFFRFIYNNMMTGLEDLGLLPSLYFLDLTAGFDIGEKLIDYSRESTFADAFVVGLFNTLRVAFLGIIFATLLGIIVGVARLSTNFVVNKLASIFIEILRNVPLLVFMIILYQGVFLKLPLKDDHLEWGSTLISNRGIYIPWGIPTEAMSGYSIYLVIGLVLAVVVALVLRQQGKRTGRPALIAFWAPATFIVVAAIGWFLTPSAPLEASIPFYDGRSFKDGLQLTPNFLGLFVALVVYTAAFIAEIVRAGIMAVSKGQIEAARSLGLNGFQTMRLVVFPQAMRIIVPPLTSQYLNLTKNSSLATALGYPDLFQVATTVNMQTGRAIEVFAIVMAVYLSFSLTTSAFMNWYNKKIALVER